jgi:hypothetical protein
MSNKLVNPLHLAVIIQYALIHRDQPNGQDSKSLASFFIKSMELKLKSQHLPHHTLIEEDQKISEFDKSLFSELLENDYFDVDLYRSENFSFLTRLLYTANFQTLVDQYGQDSVKDMNLDLLIQIVMDKKKEAYKYAKGLSYLAFIKLLDNLHYQCYEMKGYQNSLCKSFIDLVNYHIIRIQPEYCEAPWDITTTAV